MNNNQHDPKNNFDFEILIQSLKSSNVEVRAKAAWELCFIENHLAIEPLLLATQDSESLVRRNAALALFRYDDSRVIELGFDLLKDQNKQVREVATKILAVPNRVTVSRLIELLKSENNYIRFFSAIQLSSRLDKKSLENLGIPLADFSEDQKIIQSLIIAAKDKDSNVRNAVITGFGKIIAENSDVFNIIVNAINDEEKKIRQKAIQTLGKLGDERALILLKELLRSNDSNIRWHAATALGKLGNEQALPYLELLQQSQHSEDRKVATSAIEQIYQSNNKM